MFKGLVSIMYKESRHILRDPRTLYLAIGMPVIQLVIFGFGISYDVENVPVAIIEDVPV